MGAESLSHLRKLAGGVGGLGAPDSTGKRSLYIAKNITLVLLKNVSSSARESVILTHFSILGMNDVDDGDDDVPDLVENFDEACKDEVPSISEVKDDDDVPELIENGDASKEE